MHKTPEGKNMDPQPPGIRGMSIELSLFRSIGAS
jgi:hypothetical protein